MRYARQKCTVGILMGRLILSDMIRDILTKIQTVKKKSEYTGEVGLDLGVIHMTAYVCKYNSLVA